jgi:hypothetical protein
MEKFNIDEAFEEYLKMSELKPSEMSEIQLTETRRAFFAGSGYMLMALIKVNNTLKMHEALPVFESFKKQVSNFWETEVNNANHIES